MRRVSLAIVLLLAGCTRPSPDSAGLESRVKILEDQVADLRTQNAELRTQNEALENRIAELDSRISALPAASPTPPAPPVMARCKGTAPSFRLTQGQLDETLENLAGLSRDVRIVPYFEGGQPIGFKMFAIRPDSFFASCGFENGDVVESFNGLPLSSPDKALEAYSKAKNATRFDVAIVRAGQPQTITIAVK